MLMCACKIFFASINLKSEIMTTLYRIYKGSVQMAESDEEVIKQLKEINNRLKIIDITTALFIEKKKINDWTHYNNELTLQDYTEDIRKQLKYLLLYNNINDTKKNDINTFCNDITILLNIYSKYYQINDADEKIRTRYEKYIRTETLYNIIQKQYKSQIDSSTNLTKTYVAEYIKNKVSEINIFDVLEEMWAVELKTYDKTKQLGYNKGIIHWNAPMDNVIKEMKNNNIFNTNFSECIILYYKLQNHITTCFDQCITKILDNYDNKQITSITFEIDNPLNNILNDDNSIKKTIDNINKAKNLLIESISKNNIKRCILIKIKTDGFKLLQTKVNSMYNQFSIDLTIPKAKSACSIM